MTSTRGTYQVRGLNLAYHTWGCRRDSAVLLIHGILDHGLSFAPMVEAISQSFFVVAVDLRGHGYSDWVGAGGYYHFYDHYTDVLTLVENLDVKRLSIVGHSMGGSVAIGVAAALGKCVEALVLFEGIGRPFQEEQDILRRLHQWHRALGRGDVSGDVDARRRARTPMANLEDAAFRLRSLNPRLSHEASMRLAKTATEPAGPNAQRQVVWRFDPLHRTPAVKPLLRGESEAMCREARAPVLSLYGSDSQWKRRAVDRNRSFRFARVGVVEDAAHNLHHDRPQLLAGVVTDWVEGRFEAIWPGIAPLEIQPDSVVELSG